MKDVSKIERKRGSGAIYDYFEEKILMFLLKVLHFKIIKGGKAIFDCSFLNSNTNIIYLIEVTCIMAMSLMC